MIGLAKICNVWKNNKKYSLCQTQYVILFMTANIPITLNAFLTHIKGIRFISNITVVQGRMRQIFNRYFLQQD
jgi:hypothetical protein